MYIRRAELGKNRLSPSSSHTSYPHPSPHLIPLTYLIHHHRLNTSIVSTISGALPRAIRSDAPRCPLSWPVPPGAGVRLGRHRHDHLGWRQLSVWISSVSLHKETADDSNHNMDPAVVGSPQFGQIFRTKLPGNYGGVPEQVFASPLVYTPGDGVQYVYLATQQNNIYKLDAKTGVIVAQRNLHIPFLTTDLDGCVDINPHVGSTATGVIDPSTGTWYLTTKTYIDQNPSGPKGRPNGRYYFHAISTDDLSERAGFPVSPENNVARNNPERMFTGGIHHQRPALLHQGQYIYAGFASHCVQYNFTGWIMGWDKNTGRQVEMYATEGAGVKNTVPGGGVWMSGGGLASDGRGSMFFGTGNGYASQLKGIPVSGRQPPTSLEEAAVHMTINDDGTLTPVDFFRPWEKTQLDGADKDLGTSPLQLLPSQFSCGGVRRIGVITGKSGKTYWIDMDNMGGYQNGPNKLDSVLQVYQNENSVYAGAGVYPLEGGYIYINVIQYKTHVFKFSCDAGVPSFTKVADSPEKNAYILGVGHGTVTSLRDQPGTGLVWTSDVENANLRIYNAVPKNGELELIKSFVIPGTTKFQRPVFGDGRVYHTTTLGWFYGFGSPVNLPLNCTSIDFGTVGLNQTSNYTTIQCTASVNTQITSFDLSGNRNFVLGNATLPLNLQKGQTFSLQAAFTPTQVGPLSSDVLINTATQDGFTGTTPVRLRGTGQSVNAILAFIPNTVSFDGVVLGEATPAQSMILLNQGNTDLTIASVDCSNSTETGPFTPAAVENGRVSCGGFTLSRVPSAIAGNSQSTVSIDFSPTTSGNYASFVRFNSDGGKKVVTIVGVAGTSSKALLEFQTPDGKWVAYDNSTELNFGDVLENTSRNLVLRLTNVGDKDSGRLSITVSKPPFGVLGIIGARNQIDLGEGINLAPGESANATLFCSVPKSQINVNSYVGTAQWTMNLGDPSFGKQFIKFKCNAVSEQAAPLYDNGTSRYRYQGCFRDNVNGRNLQTQIYTIDDSTNEKCVKACADKGYAYAGESAVLLPIVGHADIKLPSTFANVGVATRPLQRNIRSPRPIATSHVPATSTRYVPETALQQRCPACRSSIIPTSSPRRPRGLRSIRAWRVTPVSDATRKDLADARFRSTRIRAKSTRSQTVLPLARATDLPAWNMGRNVTVGTS